MTPQLLMIIKQTLFILSRAMTTYQSVMMELTDNVEQMKAIFPDCDPDYIYYMLESRLVAPRKGQGVSGKVPLTNALFAKKS